MQYQIYEKDTRELIAWIDTESNNIVLHNGYDVQSGSSLRVVDEDGLVLPKRKKKEEGYVFSAWVSTEKYINLEVAWNAETIEQGKATLPIRVIDAMERIMSGSECPRGMEYSGSMELTITDREGEYVDEDKFVFQGKFPLSVDTLYVS